MRDIQPLLEAPSLVVLAVYRADGTIFMSPLWFHAADGGVELVIAEGDAKLARLRAAIEPAPQFVTPCG